jgi:hypothetical protein
MVPDRDQNLKNYDLDDLKLSKAKERIKENKEQLQNIKAVC